MLQPSSFIHLEAKSWSRILNSCLSAHSIRQGSFPQTHVILERFHQLSANTSMAAGLIPFSLLPSAHVHTWHFMLFPGNLSFWLAFEIGLYWSLSLQSVWNSGSNILYSGSLHWSVWLLQSLCVHICEARNMTRLHDSVEFYFKPGEYYSSWVEWMISLSVCVL